MKPFNKQFLLGLSLLFALPFVLTTQASASVMPQGDSLYVFCANGDPVSYAVENVDSIIYEKPRTASTEWTTVDLGLPSGVRWADRNVGAGSREEAGGFYAWGETDEKQLYDDVTYAYYKDGTYQDLGLDIAGTEYDVAHVKWGEGWRMPSHNDFIELRECCSWAWTSQNGRYGYTVTGPNGQSIFLPAAGYKYDSEPESVDRMGNYWTSTAGYTKDGTSIIFQILEKMRTTARIPRYWGYTVRPVYTLDSLYVCLNDGAMVNHAIADVDSIVFGTPTVTPDENLKAVDLGLSVKWASMNIGANSPEERGNHYAWGETEEKAYYDENTYLYNADGSYQNIGKDIAGTEYDVAHVEWGGDWRMPTSAEIEELQEQCTWAWTTQNNVNGYRVTGPNGQSIFLPAAGYRSGPNIFSADEYDSCGYYWSSSYNVSNSFYARGLYFTASSFKSYYNGRRETGLSVRAVCP